MATKNLVPRGDLEGKLGLSNRRWEEINAGKGEFDSLKVDDLKNKSGNNLFTSSDNSVSITKVGTGLDSDLGAGFQYNFTTSGGSASPSDKIFEGASPNQNSVETIRTESLSKITFTIDDTERWLIDESGHMLPGANNSYNLGSTDYRIKEVHLMPDSLRFEAGAINVSNSKRLQFGIPNNSNFVFDNISLIKNSVKVATTEQISSQFSYSNGVFTATGTGQIANIDGQSLSLNDRILVKDETNKDRNGIYYVSTLGDATTNAVLTRSDDLNTGEDFLGINVSVLTGTENGQKIFFTVPHTDGGTTVGTHNQTWLTFDGSLTTETIQDTVSDMLQSGGGISWSYNDTAGTITPSLSLSLNDLSDVNTGTLDASADEKVLQWNWDETSGTGEFGLATVSSGGTSRTDDEIRDLAGGLLAGGTHTGISFSYSAETNTLSSSISADFVKKNENTIFGTNTGTQPSYDFHTNSVILKVKTPTALEHAANKQYVDAAMQGISKILSPAKAATTQSINLSTDLVSGYTIDQTVSLSVGDRVLVKDQTTASENGVYVIGHVGVGGTPGNGQTATSRATDLAAGSRAHANFIFVKDGTDNGGNGFICITPAGGTNPDKSDWTDEVGADSLEFAQFSSAGDISAGNALQLQSAGTLNVLYDDSTITLNSDTPAKLQVGTITFSNISGSLPADKLPDSALTTSSTITATSMAASGITGIEGMSGSIVTLEDADLFIINDASDTSANPTQSNIVKKGGAGRILEYVQNRLTGHITATKLVEDGTNNIFIKTSLDKKSITEQPLLDTSTDSLGNDDLFLFADSSNSNSLKSVKWSDISSATLNINDLTPAEDEQVAGLDEIAIYNNSTSENRKVTINQIKSAVSSGLSYKKIETDGTVSGITTNTHFHIIQQSSGEFNFNLSSVTGVAGDIIKITMSPFSNSYLSDSRNSGTLHSTASNIVRVTLSGCVLLYNQFDFEKPVEFLHDGSTWRPSLPNEKEFVNDRVIPLAGVQNIEYYLFDQGQYANFTSHYVHINSSSINFRIPNAEKIVQWGYKNGHKKTLYFTHEDNTTITINSSTSNTNSGSSVSDILSRGDTNSNSWPSTTSQRSITFTKTASIKKVCLVLKKWVTGTNVTKHYWDIEYNADSSGSIIPDGAENGHVLKVEVNSPATLVSGLIDNININDSAITAAKIGDGEVTSSKISDNDVTFTKIQKVNTKKALGSLNTSTSTSQDQVVGEINILTDLDPTIDTEHSNLVTATAIKNYVTTQIDSIPQSAATGVQSGAINLSYTSESNAKTILSNTHILNGAVINIEHDGNYRNLIPAVNGYVRGARTSTYYNRLVSEGRSFIENHATNRFKVYMPSAKDAFLQYGEGVIIEIDVRVSSTNNYVNLTSHLSFLPNPADPTIGYYGEVSSQATEGSFVLPNLSSRLRFKYEGGTINATSYNNISDSIKPFLYADNGNMYQAINIGNAGRIDNSIGGKYKFKLRYYSNVSTIAFTNFAPTNADPTLQNAYVWERI